MSKEEMIKSRKYIHNIINQYLNANNYTVNENKSKDVYALDSIVAEYTDIKGNKDNIKIEINYMNRVHILETKKLSLNNDIFRDRHLQLNCVNPIEIYATKVCALINRTTSRDLFDVYTLSKYELFDENEKKLLRKCFFLNYIAICNYKLEDMKIDVIEKLDKQDIKTKLLPTLKDRNPKNNDINVMKLKVREYLKDILVIDNKVEEFYNKFKQNIFEPELLFEDNEIIDRIKFHPMINWKLRND